MCAYDNRERGVARLHSFWFPEALKARLYYERLVALTSTADTERPRSQASQAVLVEELRHHMTPLRRLICLLTTGGLLAVGTGGVRADSTGPVPATPSRPQAAPSAEEEYNRGLTSTWVRPT